MERLWTDYVSRVHPEVPGTKQIEGWGLNLRMMVYLVHPTGEIVTDYSGRQDLGSVHDLSPHYLPYAIFAPLHGDPTPRYVTHLC